MSRFGIFSALLALSLLLAGAARAQDDSSAAEVVGAQAAQLQEEIARLRAELERIRTEQREAQAEEAELAEARRQLEDSRRELERAARNVAVATVPQAVESGAGHYIIADAGRGMVLSHVGDETVIRTLSFASAPWSDMELVPLTDELGRYFGTSEGLLVVRGPADDSLEIQDGDVILAISGRGPNSPEHAIRILSSFEAGETIEFSIMRQGQPAAIEYIVPETIVEDFRRVPPAEALWSLRAAPPAPAVPAPAPSAASPPAP